MTSRQPKLIVNLTRGNVVCERGVVADGRAGRMRGLLGRQALPAGEGLLLMPTPSIHTAFMRFPIDVAFLDRNLRIVKLVERLSPFRTAASRHARSVLELAAGENARRGLAVGDRLALLDRGARRGGDSHPGARVLLIASDRRFRTVASALLTRRGYRVSASESDFDVAGQAVRDRAEVVVLDASSSLTAAALDGARLNCLRPPVGIVAVSDEPGDGLASLPVLPKWGSFGSLFDAIEQARRRRRRREGSE